jgi:hypothetical protein
MILTAAPRRARWAGRLRLAILVAVALLVGHTAVYALEDGLGSSFAAAMARDGHGAWWFAVVALVAISAGAAASRAVAHLARLESRARGTRRSRADGSFRREATGIARTLLPLVIALFTVQENLEGLVAHGRLVGLDAVIGADRPFAIPILAAVALALSLAGAVVRWRIATLRRRIAHGTATPRRSVATRPLPAGWTTSGALTLRRWMLDRLEAGRSPPLLLPR